MAHFDPVHGDDISFRKRLASSPSATGILRPIHNAIASDALLQSIDLAVAAEELGADGAYFAFIILPANSARRRPRQRRAELEMNMQSSTLKIDESGRPFHIQQAEQIGSSGAWKAAGHKREPRVSVSRSIFALVDDRDHAYFGRGNENQDQIGFLGGDERAIFGRSYAAEPNVLVEHSRKTKPSRRLTRYC